MEGRFRDEDERNTEQEIIDPLGYCLVNQVWKVGYSFVNPGCAGRNSITNQTLKDSAEIRASRREMMNVLVIHHLESCRRHLSTIDDADREQYLQLEMLDFLPPTQNEKFEAYM